MGPRKFVAKRLTGFLLDHGNLDERFIHQIHLERSFELKGPTRSSAPSDGAHHVHELQLPAHHTAMLFIASLVMTRHIKKRMDWKKKERLYSPSSDLSSSLSNGIDWICWFFAISSWFLVAVLIVLFLGEGVLDVRLLEEEKMPYAIYVTSLWLVVASVLLRILSSAWNILKPRNSVEASNFLPIGSDICQSVVLVLSVGTILLLAYNDLPLLRQVIHGETHVDLGLPPVLVGFVEQFLSSFFAFCIFYKFVPANKALREGSNNVGMRRQKKHLFDPDIIRRMSMLAIEAREHVQSRKNGQKLRRTYSEGNFNVYNAPRTPPTRRQSVHLLPSLPEDQLTSYSNNTRVSKKLPSPPESPLMDIHLAGPTSSPKDLMKKLKANKRIRASVSTGCLTALPKLCEEGSPTSMSGSKEYMRSNPQSSSPIPKAKCLL